MASVDHLDDERDRRWLTWVVRAPGGADGVPFSRGRSAPVDRMLIHAAPPVLDVEVFDNGERLLAQGTALAAAEDAGPIEVLVVDGLRVLRTSTDPTDELGVPVLLAGGEIGVLRSWEFSTSGDGWRWTIELEGGRG